MERKGRRTYLNDKKKKVERRTCSLIVTVLRLAKAISVLAGRHVPCDFSRRATGTRQITSDSGSWALACSDEAEPL